MEKQTKNVQILELHEDESVKIFNTVDVGKNRIEFLSLKFIEVSTNPHYQHIF